MTVVDAWRLHCLLVGSKEALIHLEFRREIAIAVMKIGLEVSRKRKAGLNTPVSMEGYYHLIQ